MNSSPTNGAAPVLVTGGTGTLGGHVVPLLRAAGRDVRVLARTARPAQAGVEFVAADLGNPDDLATVAAALSGVEVVLHLAGGPKGDERLAQHLVDAIAQAGTRPHVVYISVVGADRTPVVSGVDRAMFGYVAAKRAAEEIIAASGLSFTTLRATQFHDLALKMFEGMAKMPVVPVPAGTRMQPVETAEVAARLVELALGAPQGLVPDLAGPRVYGMDDLARSYLAAVGRRRPVLGLRMPGRAAAAFRDGANLSPERGVGVRTWEDFLAERVA